MNNRPIKFRAWDKIDNLLLDCVEINFHQKWVALVYNNGEGGELQQRKFGDIELNQFTGLTDKNGKEIYEGDIVQHIILNNLPINAEVYWEERRLGWCLKSPVEFLKIHAIPTTWQTHEMQSRNNIEVLGNIYENPELLRKKESEEK